MSEYAIPITNLNDFVFCPVSIYFHGLDFETEKMTYQSPHQLNGTAAHKAIDAATYSSSSSILQGISIYSEQYNLIGKIDIYDETHAILRERKKLIKSVYDGYVFQLYGQCVSMREMGYTVKRLSLYSMDDNKTYNVPLPEEDDEMFEKFEKLISEIENFSFKDFRQTNFEKCAHCIYEPLCAFSKPMVDK